MSLTTAQRALYGRIGAAVARARHDPRELTAEARKTFLARFEAQVRSEHPDLPEPEVHRRAGELRKAYFMRLAAASSRARSKKKASSGGRKPDDALEVRDATARPSTRAA